jgi:acyl-CoA synthetase (AMP-forming)/AMP-acid ligase II
MARVLASILAIGALAPAVTATAGEPPPREDDLCPRDEGCLEQCGLADSMTETPSPLFLEKLASIAPTKHHIAATRAPALAWV